jgi:hypothetical protein
MAPRFFSESLPQRIKRAYQSSRQVGLWRWSEKHDAETVKSRVDALRRLAYDEFKRPVQVWNSSYVVCRPTEKEAKDYLNYYVKEKGDWEAVENLVRIFGMQSLALPSHVLEEFKC